MNDDGDSLFAIALALIVTGFMVLMLSSSDGSKRRRRQRRIEELREQLERLEKRDRVEAAMAEEPSS